MKSITFRVTDKGNGYLATALVPANHSEALGVNKVGLAIAGVLLLMTLAFIGYVGVSVLAAIR